MLIENTTDITKVNFLLLLKAIQKLGDGLNIDISAELNSQNTLLGTRFDAIDSALNNQLNFLNEKLNDTQELFINSLTVQQSLTLESNWLNGNYTGNALSVLPGQVFIDGNYYYLIGLDFKPIRLLKDSKLTTIENKIDQLINNQSVNGLNFTLLTLNPTYQTYASNGWAIAPSNLQALYDNDASSASNLFQPNGAAWQYGEVVMMPGVSIPNFTRINFKVGLRNTSGTRGLFELSAFNVVLSSYVTIWSYSENVSNSQDIIANIDAIVPFSWDKLRWRLTDIGSYLPQSRFYDLKVWEVS